MPAQSSLRRHARRHGPRRRRARPHRPLRAQGAVTARGRPAPGRPKPARSWSSWGRTVPARHPPSKSLEGYRRPTSGHIIGARAPDPIADHRQLTASHGRDAAERRRLPDARRPPGPRPLLALLPRPAPHRDLLDLVALRAVAATPWRHLSGGENSGSRSPWPSSAGPRWPSSTSRRPASTPRAAWPYGRSWEISAAQGVCVLLTTHELAEAEKMADRIVILSAGPGGPRGYAADLTAATGRAGSRLRRSRRARHGSLAAALGGGARVTEGAGGRYRVTGRRDRPTTALGHLAGAAQRDADRPGDRATLEEVYFEAVGAGALEQTAAAKPAPTTRPRPVGEAGDARGDRDDGVAEAGTAA